jgi:succinate dehydrogenase/fumarate reductase flavoprotein subunit
MNAPAIALYKAHGIDLAREPLEIAVCAQHNNGGFRANLWWESNVRGLFPVGEACGTHGVTRPGGSALNAGQVGSARAALFISRRRAGRPLADAAFVHAAEGQVLERRAAAEAMLARRGKGGLAPAACLAEVRRRMSACGAAVRRAAEVAEERVRARELWSRARRELRAASPRDLPRAFKALDIALTHALFLEAIAEYLERGGRSRGSFLVPDPSGRPPHPKLGRGWAFSLAERGDFVAENILEVRLDDKGRVRKRWVPVRPVPEPDGWFENVWDDYRNDRIVAEEE